MSGIVNSAGIRSGVIGYGANTPAFFASISTNQSIANGVNTLVSLATVVLDTNSAFTNTASNYKFTVPSGEASNYLIIFGVRNYNFAPSRLDLKLYKDGAEYTNAENASGSTFDTSHGSAIVDLSVGSYLQLYIYQDSGSSNSIDYRNNNCYMSGFKLNT